MTFVVETEIAASPDATFDAMADARNEIHWNSQVTRAELVSGDPVRLGTRFKTVNRGAEYDALISEFERPAALAFEVRGAQMDIDARFHFEAADGGRTQMRGEFEMRPKGVMKFLLPLMSPMVRRDFPKQAARFKAFCEKGWKPRSHA